MNKVLVQQPNLQPLALKSLSLNQQSVGFLPTYVSMFKNLERLDLSHNQLTELPVSILCLKKLRSISLAGNHKLNLPKALLLLAELPRLIKVDLSSCQIKSLPPEVYHLEKLRTLILDNNPIDALSEKQLMNLPSRLEALSIRGCAHTAVSTRLRQFSKLKEIRIDYCDYDYMLNINLLQPKVALAVV